MTPGRGRGRLFLKLSYLSLRELCLQIQLVLKNDSLDETVFNIVSKICTNFE